ncbi:hypothetical protein [Anabaena catenula]|uniref:Uncharacterized protein n=1 Tax=Anabaena catenula FACHB-362 TaxID=2692877 RepID=A0ABR8JCH1_9NOST|nr:hypothetical protein [Anabaena catenula]MBD2695160.1 hypothetical protein [Anabaena catenula FACHB-362]
MLDVTSESNFNIKSVQEILASFTNTKPKSSGGSNSSILVFEYQDPPGECLNHTTVVPFFECITSNSYYKRIAEDNTISERAFGNEISFFTSGINYKMEWNEPLSYTLLGINPSFFARELSHNSIELFSILSDKLSDDDLIKSLICAVTKVALNPKLVNDPILYINTHANSLVVHLLSYFGTKRENTNNFSKNSLKKINNWLDYKIEMDETIEYDEILEILGMDRMSEFICLFENSTGIKFYQYCIEKRKQIYRDKYASVYKQLSRSRMLKILEIISERVQSDQHKLND